VSEYVPKIQEIIEKLMDKHYAYESDGCVYFDVEVIDQCYGKFLEFSCLLA
jgi:cysteinyl-tRNA synthetase